MSGTRRLIILCRRRIYATKVQISNTFTIFFNFPPVLFYFLILKQFFKHAAFAYFCFSTNTPTQIVFAEHSKHKYMFLLACLLILSVKCLPVISHCCLLTIFYNITVRNLLCSSPLILLYTVGIVILCISCYLFSFLESVINCGRYVRVQRNINYKFYYNRNYIYYLRLLFHSV